VRDIATTVGINQATLLYHFRDKEELIVALVDDLIERLTSLNEGYAIEPGSFAAFNAHLRTLGELYASKPEIYVVLNEIGVRALRHAKIAAKLAAVEEDWAQYIGALLRAAHATADDAAIAAAAQATVVFVRGVGAKAAGDGTLATLMTRGKGRAAAARRIVLILDTYAGLVHAAFGP
jgi:AcrR family transcriptional regulator